VIAPADGLVTMIATVPPPRELAGGDGLGSDPVIRVSIYMSMFDCHVIRTPVEGVVRRVAYVQGKLVNPQFDKASEDNEREHLMVQAMGGERIGFTLIAGVIGRRIVSWVREGEAIAAGQRVAMIRFGSRTDVYLPAGTSSQVPARSADGGGRDGPGAARRDRTHRRRRAVVAPVGLRPLTLRTHPRRAAAEARGFHGMFASTAADSRRSPTTALRSRRPSTPGKKQDCEQCVTAFPLYYPQG
jgi:phosphatidylserine decarboxylase precursor-related protein